MKIAIFYHILQSGMSAFIYQSQLHRLYTSGLIEAAEHIHFGVNGNQELFNVPEKVKIVYNQDLKSEKDTLLSLIDFCNNNPEHKVLYLHTKGATKDSINVQSWRLMMEHFVIDKWKECIGFLENYDCVGAEMNTVGPTLWSDGSLTHNDPIPFYAGNFWWSNASYINTIKPRYMQSECRLEKERWIGDGEYGCNAKNLFKSSCDVRNNPYEYYFRESDYVS